MNTLAIVVLEKIGMPSEVLKETSFRLGIALLTFWLPEDTEVLLS